MDIVGEVERLKGFALRLTRNATDAEDLMQETVLKAWANREQFEQGTNLRGWLSVIMRNTWYGWCRKLKREVTGENYDEAVYGLVDDDDPCKILEAKQTGKLVGIHLVLSEALKSRAMGSKYKEMAQEFNIPIGTVKSRIHRARLQLSAGYVSRADRLWSSEENDRLRGLHTAPWSVIVAAFPGRTSEAVKSRYYEMGLRRRHA
jgi:RNA polymerase sigma-70 factor (ECF subfamily)